MLTDMSSTVQCKYSWVFGDMETAAVFVREGSKSIVQSNFHVDDFVHCHEKGLLSNTRIMSHVLKQGFPSSVANMLGALSTVDGIYEKLSGATVSLKCFEKPLLESKWYNWNSLQRGATRRKLALAIVSYFDSGSCDLDPEDLDQVIAVSTGDSIYVPAQVSHCNIFPLCAPHLVSISSRFVGGVRVLISFFYRQAATVLAPLSSCFLSFIIRIIRIDWRY
jgi:hypothetical protein